MQSGNNHIDMSVANQDDHHKALAEHYAAYWNDLERVGLEPTDEGIWKVAHELQGGEWVVYHDQRDGNWKVIHHEQAPNVVRFAMNGQPLRYAVKQGTLWDAGKHPRGNPKNKGQFAKKGTGSAGKAAPKAAAKKKAPSKKTSGSAGEAPLVARQTNPVEKKRLEDEVFLQDDADVDALFAEPSEKPHTPQNMHGQNKKIDDRGWPKGTESWAEPAPKAKPADTAADKTKRFEDAKKAVERNYTAPSVLDYIAKYSGYDFFRDYLLPSNSSTKNPIFKAMYLPEMLHQSPWYSMGGPGALKTAEETLKALKSRLTGTYVLGGFHLAQIPFNAMQMIAHSGVIGGGDFQVGQFAVSAACALVNSYAFLVNLGVNLRVKKVLTDKEKKAAQEAVEKHTGIIQNATKALNPPNDPKEIEAAAQKFLPKLEAARKQLPDQSTKPVEPHVNALRGKVAAAASKALGKTVNAGSYVVKNAMRVIGGLGLYALGTATAGAGFAIVGSSPWMVGFDISPFMDGALACYKKGNEQFKDIGKFARDPSPLQENDALPMDVIKKLASDFYNQLAADAQAAQDKPSSAKYAASRTFVYKCPYCHGLAFQNDPVQGGIFQGYALCSRCGRGFSILGKKPDPRPLSYAARIAILRYKFDPNEPRDAKGEWASRRNASPSYHKQIDDHNRGFLHAISGKDPEPNASEHYLRGHGAGSKRRKQMPVKESVPALSYAAQIGIIRYAAARVPKGYIVNKDGRVFRAGMWVSQQDLSTATPAPGKDGKPGQAAHPEGPAAAHKQQAAYRHEQRRARGPVNREKLHGDKLAAHEHHELSPHEHTRAKRTFAGLHQHHGELTAHRIEELINGTHEALQHVHPDDEITRDRLSKRLRAYHHMLDMHDEKQKGGGKGSQGEAQPWLAHVTPQKGKVYQVPTEHIIADPERFQFKLNTDNKEGVTDELKGIKKFDPELAGVVSVWKDPENGKTFVVNGHHRLELAKRTGQHGLNVMYIDAPNAKIARARGAMVNIAEGRGTAVDAAKFMRDMGKTPQDMENDGVSLKGKVAADAVPLTHLNDRLFNKVTYGKMDVGQAVTIGTHVKDHDLQDLLVNRMEKEEAKGRDISPRLLSEMARKVAEAPKIKLGERGGQRGMFDDLEADDSVFLEQCELQAHVRAELAKEIGAWKPLSSERRAKKVTGEDSGNVLNVEANKQRAEEASVARGTYDRLVNRSGLISDAINKHAVELAKAQTQGERNEVKRRALTDVRNAIDSETAAGPQPLSAESGGMEAGGPGAQGGPQGDREAQSQPGAVDAAGTGSAGAPGVAPAWTDPPIEKSSYLPPAEQKIEADTQQQARAQYHDFKKRYVAANGTVNPDGSLKSIQLNTDEWRPLFKEYTGTNASAVHEASSYLNKRLLHEAMHEMRGKGNNTFAVLAGGGGSGKGTAVKQFMDVSDYPIVVDQVSDRVEKVDKLLDDAKNAGYDCSVVFVDRNPKDAWLGGVVPRATNARKKGQPARTVPLHVALKANLNARQATIALLKSGKHPVKVIDNNRGHGKAVLHEDTKAALAYLEGQQHDEAKLKEELEHETYRLHESGEIPGDIAEGLIGAGTIAHRRGQSGQPAGSGGAGPDAGRGATSPVAGVEDQGAAHGPADGGSQAPGQGAGSLTPAKGSYHEQIVNQSAPSNMPRGTKGTVLNHLAANGGKGMTLHELRAVMGEHGKHAVQAVKELNEAGKLQRDGDRVRIKGTGAATPAAAAKPTPKHEMTTTPSAFAGDEPHSYAKQIAEQAKKVNTPAPDAGFSGHPDELGLSSDDWAALTGERPEEPHSYAKQIAKKAKTPAAKKAKPANDEGFSGHPDELGLSSDDWAALTGERPDQEEPATAPAKSPAAGSDAGGIGKFTKDKDGNINKPFKVGDRDFLFKINPHGDGVGAEVPSVQFEIQTPAGGSTFKQTALGSHQQTMQVFRSVADHLHAYIGQEHPQEFKFSAESSEPSRVQLYDRLAKKIADSTGYNLVRGEAGGQVNYNFVKNAPAKSPAAASDTSYAKQIAEKVGGPLAMRTIPLDTKKPFHKGQGKRSALIHGLPKGYKTGSYAQYIAEKAKAAQATPAVTKIDVPESPTPAAKPETTKAVPSSLSWEGQPELQKKVYGKVSVKPEAGKTAPPIGSYADQIKALGAGKAFPKQPAIGKIQAPKTGTPSADYAKLIRERADKQIAEQTQQKKAAVPDTRPYALPDQGTSDGIRTWQALHKQGFIQNTFPTRTANGEFLSKKQGWVRKNPKTGKWEGFSNDDAVAHLNGSKPSSSDTVMKIDKDAVRAADQKMMDELGDRFGDAAPRSETEVLSGKLNELMAKNTKEAPAASYHEQVKAQARPRFKPLASREEQFEAMSNKKPSLWFTEKKPFGQAYDEPDKRSRERNA